MIKNNNKNNLLKIIPNVAKKIGEKSVDSACLWWINQPKVPESMKNKK